MHTPVGLMNRLGRRHLVQWRRVMGCVRPHELHKRMGTPVGVVVMRALPQQRPRDRAPLAALRLAYLTCRHVFLLTMLETFGLLMP